MIKEIKYFGTDLDQAGHFFWTIDKEYKRSIYGGVTKTFNALPFNPEGFFHSAPNGTVLYAYIQEFSICAIQGSCYDKRPGCKSVFYVEEPMFNLKEWKDVIESFPPAKAIIDKMPFKVKW